MKYQLFRQAILFTFCLLTSYFLLQAQPPLRFSYQSIIRNPAGQAMQNQSVGIRLSILQTSETGTAVYVETHSATTNASGLVTLQVGGGTVVSGIMAGINWANGPYYIKTETDPEGGSNYSISGTSQLLSVPFALYSANGTPGPQGPQGPAGPQGETGLAGPQGPQGATGAQGPAGQTGATGTQGPIGQNGSNGTNGADGKTILNGITNPTSGIGNNGDFYLNTSTNTLFGPKAAGTWPASGTSLVGPAGSIGPKGDKGDTGAAGPPGTGISGGTTPGQLLLWNGSSWLPINPGTAGQALTICNGLPTWTSNGICPASSMPSLSTSAPASITSTSATSGGNITNDGGGSIITRGVCWSTTQNPTTSLSTKTEDGGGAGSFSSSLNGLAPGTSYFVRAYATNTIGTSYGNQQSFTTLTQLADITTAEVSSISATGAVSGGNITADGGAPITTRGVCWSTSPNPTIALSTKIISGSGIGVFSSTMSGLAPGTFYYVRAFAINSVGTSYGNEISFATPVAIPALTTISVTGITVNSAFSGGNITNNGGAEIINRGVCWSTNQNPTIELSTITSDASGSGSFTSSLTGLSPNTLYYVRAYATNSAGTAYGNQVSFTTAAVVLPTLSTTAASAITSTTATSGGNISNDGGGSITTRGVCWSTSQNPTIALSTKTSDGTGSGSFTSSLSGLSPNTLYYVRAYAENSAGIGYGNEISFTTPPYFIPGSGVADIDGNAYQTIILGMQEWMKENLKTSKYRNGNSITTNLTDIDWQNTTSGAYAIYNNDAANNTTYGKLYNWYAVADPRGLCPAGWHVPTDHDWNLLTKYLDPAADTTCGSCYSSTIAGGTMKSTGTIEAGTGLWYSPNQDATNSSGFTGLPGGYRYYGGAYSYLGGYGSWWSSTEDTSALYRYLGYYDGYSARYASGKTGGFSVRCLRD